MKSSSLKATSLRSLLIFLILLLVVGVAAGFYWGLGVVRAFSVEVSHTTTDAGASDQSLTQFQQLKQTLAESQPLVDKASQVFTTEAAYQSQALKDVQKYATSFGITISSTNFDTQTQYANGHAFIVKIQSPVEYVKLLQFLDAIEGNLPKMQVLAIELSRPTTGSKSTTVVTGDITIGISSR